LISIADRQIGNVLFAMVQLLAFMVAYLRGEWY